MKAMPKKTIVIEQFVAGDGGTHNYYVLTTKNTTTPKLTEVLTEEQVNDLIGQGYEVTVKPRT